MKKTLSILFILFVVATGKAEVSVDTIDFWHVYYNNKKIKEFVEFNKGKITIKADQVKSGDKITIRFFSDTPCDDCDVFLSAETGKEKVHVKTKGERTPISIKVEELLRIGKTTKKPIKIYRSENKYPRTFLFEIEIV